MFVHADANAVTASECPVVPRRDAYEEQPTKDDLCDGDLRPLTIAECQEAATILTTSEGELYDSHGADGVLSPDDHGTLWPAGCFVKRDEKMYYNTAGSAGAFSYDSGRRICVKPGARVTESQAQNCCPSSNVSLVANNDRFCDSTLPPCTMNTAWTQPISNEALDACQASCSTHKVVSIEDAPVSCANCLANETCYATGLPLTYTIQPGDYLSNISDMFDLADWMQIYELNTDLIGDDPNLIYPGEVLTLPHAHCEPAEEFAMLACRELCTSINVANSGSIISIGMYNAVVAAASYLMFAR